ncbi:MAG: FkbM family methyltransferase [Nitrososphaeraceae archaeon]
MGKLNSWLLKETVGVTLFDKCILMAFKLLYLFLRLILTIVLGKKRRDILYNQKGISFNSFLYNTIKKFGLYNYILLRIKVPKYNYMFYCRGNNEDFIFMTGHEDELLPHFKSNSGDIVVDVGSHIGHHTLIAAKRVGPKGKVISIEADPKNFEILNKNIELNRLKDNVITINCAVSSKEEKIKLYTPEEESGNTIYNTIISDRVSPEENFVEINANTLDNLLNENGISVKEVNWIKIDVEGAELEVLKGAHEILSESKNITLLIEIHGLNLYKSIVNHLNIYNFKIEFEKGGGEWRHIIASKRF